MTAGEQDGQEAALPIEKDEQFLHTVVTDDVIEADAALWATFEQFLGNDPWTAWVLAEVTHKPFQPVDEAGAPDGPLKLATTGTWKRDPNVATPDRQFVPIELPDDDDDT